MRPPGPDINYSRSEAASCLFIKPPLQSVGFASDIVLVACWHVVECIKTSLSLPEAGLHLGGWTYEMRIVSVEHCGRLRLQSYNVGLISSLSANILRGRCFCVLANVRFYVSKEGKQQDCAAQQKFGFRTKLVYSTSNFQFFLYRKEMLAFDGIVEWVIFFINVYKI